MKKRGEKIRFIHNIQNQQFRRLFFKNWLLVFFSIMLPLCCCTVAIQYYSSKSLIQEIDASVQRIRTLHWRLYLRKFAIRWKRNG